MRHDAIGQRGVALVSAIFLLVVLAALGAYMVTLSGVEQTTTNRSLTNTRIYFAARAGLEWGIHQVVSPALAAACPATATFSPAGYGFDGIGVTVGCNRNLFSLGGVNTYIYTLTSTATHASTGTTEYVERKLEASVCRSDDPGANRCGDT